MPTSTRRQVRARNQRLSEQSTETPSDDVHGTGVEYEEDLAHEAAYAVGVERMEEEMEVEGHEEEEEEEEIEEEEDEEEEEEETGDITDHEVPFPPPGLKEISSLASWTVSTCKPGNGVAALRSPSPSHFWQSDGPQPHYLTIHFFKLVHIVHMRIFVNFAQDESYTPTKMQFWAGMAMHDLELFSEMALEQPMGWVDVDMGSVGPILEGGEEDEDEDGEIDWSRRPVLRAFVVQVKILENHQNGKDTHLRAVQLFARDEGMGGRGGGGLVDAGSAGGSFVAEVPVRTKKRVVMRKTNNIKMAEWMMDPELR